MLFMKTGRFVMKNLLNFRIDMGVNLPETRSRKKPYGKGSGALTYSPELLWQFIGSRGFPDVVPENALFT